MIVVKLKLMHKTQLVKGLRSQYMAYNKHLMIRLYA